ncbi:MAG: beta-ribofuranosylaminobenzene 5'-phosphate synthase, partial [Planctomycetota bacterium]
MKRVTIRTGARLHFGLLDTEPPFGGIGAMVACPQTVVTVSASHQFRADRTIESRATLIAERFATFLGQTGLPEVSISAEQLSPQHVGFGSGTQLSLAIAECLCELFGIEPDFETLCRDIADRGKRSAVG